MIIYIVIGVAVILLATIFLLRPKESKRAGPKPKQKRVVLLGCSLTGKTALFYTLGRGESPQTVTSFKVSQASVLPKGCGKKVELVDVPGHEQFKREAEAKLTHASGIIYVVDASTRDMIYKAALDLYDYLVLKSLQRLAIPMLIVANKQDLDSSVDKEGLVKQLEREIDRIKRTRNAFNDDDDKVDDYLKASSDRFSFEEVRGVRVSFADASISKGSISEIQEFLNNEIKLGK